MVDLSDTAAITGPFNFEPIYSSNNTRSKVNRNTWKMLPKTCTHRNIILPTLGSQISHQPSIHKLFKTSKIKIPQTKS